MSRERLVEDIKAKLDEAEHELLELGDATPDELTSLENYLDGVLMAFRALDLKAYNRRNVDNEE